MSLVNLKINNIDVQVEPDSTILEAATKAGFDIPTFCHAENLKPFTSCFVCAVKVEGGKGNLVPSCATKVREGMVVTVEDEEIDATRRMCLNLLLSDHCGDCLPPCEDACPSSIDIRGFLALVKEGKEVEAAKLIREKAPFPGILGRICPRPCEDACRRTRVDEPISICFMKRHISDTELKELGTPAIPEAGPATGKKVAIVGAGPSGMSAAYYLRLAGHEVTVFEKHETSGGMLRFGIPYYRLTDETLKSELGIVERMGVEVKYGVEIGKDISAKSLEADYDSVILAIGAQGASSMRVPGEDTEGVWAGIDYLGKIGEGENPELGKRVYIVGGGNTAIDCSRTALRAGADVTVLYRRTRAEMPASDFEIDEAIHEGVKFDFLNAPVKIEKDGDTIKMSCVRMELGEPDESGRRRPVPVEGSEYIVEASAVIGAIGQKVVPDGIQDLGIDISRWGTILTDAATFQTNRPGIFASGDCQTGADIAVRAVGNGRKTAYSVNQFLSGLEVSGEPVLFNSTMGPLETVSEDLFTGFEKAARIEMPVIGDDLRRTTHTEVETGFNMEEARAEAGRCLECGCDAVEDCKLRQYSTRYNVDQSLFAGERRTYLKDGSHDKMKIEHHKCINCGACVRACAEVKGLDVLAYVGRGFTTRMTAPFGRSLVDTACDGCGECAKVCPTAGIMLKELIAVK
ncbi:MAG: FAD-dependent oxidoreductase [Spirochaetales bacterium]|nr:FAD-dependent oxidoreductase [Spirochaetales bacterium]